MPYTQKERMCRVVSPLGEDALLLTRMSARESLSRLFRYELELLSEREDLAFAQIVGQPLGVSVRLADGSERWFHGIVSRFEHGAAFDRFAAYRAELVPWFWILTRRVSCRIYQHLSVPDIARKLFGELGFADYRLELSGSYPEREYCVQYRESDFDFLSRLFEDSGISYFFEHGEKAHTLVLFDAPDAVQPCPSQPSARYASGQGAEGEPVGDIRNLCFERELRPGAYALSDYNFEQPSLSLLTNTTSSACVGSNAKLEIYEYPGSYSQPPDGDSLVKTRMEAEECASVRVRGASHCAAFTPGYRFDLKGHFRQECNDAYLLTEITHLVTESAGDGGDGLASYDNEFSSIPHAVPFRPQRTSARPILHGVQTATIVGAAGKEIDVDSHGRVVVQFHWDREGKRDEKSSCRVRVAQNWAGKGWGLIAHPRIGQEVIVEFLEGDPDRPIITGRVYNGEQPLPYTTPTQSGLKSRSSPGGAAGNFNELRFEDKKGSELVFIQSEKDRSTLTKNDDTQNVGHDRVRTVVNDETVTVQNNQKVDVTTDRTRSVGKNESVTVGVDETRSVGSNRTRSVGANEAVSVGANETRSVAANRTRTVGQHENLTVNLTRTRNVGINEMVNIGAAQEVTVGGARTLTVGAAQITSIGAVHAVTVGSKEVVSIGGSQSVNVAKDRKLTVAGSLVESISKDYSHKTGKALVIDAGDQITIKTGKASITMKKNGDIVIQGKQINVKGKGNVTMRAKKILEN